MIQDLNSANGTYVNRKRVPPGEKRALAEEDIIQVGPVQLMFTTGDPGHFKEPKAWLIRKRGLKVTRALVSGD